MIIIVLRKGVYFVLYKDIVFFKVNFKDCNFKCNIKLFLNGFYCFLLKR